MEEDKERGEKKPEIPVKKKLFFCENASKVDVDEKTQKVISN